MKTYYKIHNHYIKINLLYFNFINTLAILYLILEIVLFINKKMIYGVQIFIQVILIYVKVKKMNYVIQYYL